MDAFIPTIGILTQPGDGCQGRVSTDPYASYIGGSYNKVVECGGSKTMPIIYDEPVEVRMKKLGMVNGILLMGGMAHAGPYHEVVKEIYQHVLVMNQSGIHFPLFALCLGHQQLIRIVTGIDNKDEILDTVDAKFFPTRLSFRELAPPFDGSFDNDLKSAMEHEDIVMHSNQFGITLGKFQENQKLSDFFHILTTTFDRGGQEFVSSVLARHYPIWGFQFHPEKNAFESGNARIPHSERAIEVTTFFGKFFAREAKRCVNRPDSQAVRNDLIYNHLTGYSGKHGKGFDEVYVFLKLDLYPLLFEALFILGRIADNTVNMEILELGFPTVVGKVDEAKKLDMLGKVALALSKCGDLRPAFPFLKKLADMSFMEVISIACTAISSYLSDTSNDKIEAVLDSGMLTRLLELLRHPSSTVRTPTARIFGFIVSGDMMQTQIIDDILPCLFNLLNGFNGKGTKRDVCWIISNMTAGNTDKIQAVIQSDIIRPIVRLLQNADFDVKKEAVLTVFNAISNGTDEQIKFLVSQGCVKPLCDLLECLEPETIMACLGGLENVLQVGEADKNLGHTGNVNRFAEMIDEVGGTAKIESLQSLPNNEIRGLAVRILEIYWPEGDDHINGPDEFFHFGVEFPIPPGGFHFN